MITNLFTLNIGSKFKLFVYSKKLSYLISNVNYKIF